LDIGDHFHRKHANILDDEFLIDNIQLFVALSRERPLVLDVGNDWVNIDVPLFEIDIVVRSFIIPLSSSIISMLNIVIMVPIII
jgi:hypothetical protein